MDISKWQQWMRCQKFMHHRAIEVQPQAIKAHIQVRKFTIKCPAPAQLGPLPWLAILSPAPWSLRKISRRWLQDLPMIKEEWSLVFKTWRISEKSNQLKVTWNFRKKIWGNKFWCTSRRHWVRKANGTGARLVASGATSFATWRTISARTSGSKTTRAATAATPSNGQVTETDTSVRRSARPT